MALCRSSRTAVVVVTAIVTTFLHSTRAEVADSAKSAPTLTSKGVLEIARAEALRIGVDLARYSNKSPKFNPKTREWEVVFPQKGPPYIPDANFWVVVNDATGKPCLLFPLSFGKCA
jgi:hypothetical protein